ncbi:hypothetical protein TNIN_426121 [Trichonephila inaurata madagascariensis]|uniref:Uncharacterized protein n=1 Tax=Trichonephila inaurata madagascariensis TaxID=2747483 RepID=A0A8X6JPW0_9ARAC|nr:hypothetical protein TNIN_426121 [Trichonephila inaurata madagascariensis]
MSCTVRSSLTVDQLVSPQQGPNQQLDRSVIIQIEDEEDEVAPPCTMELDMKTECGDEKKKTIQRPSRHPRSVKNRRGPT